MHRFRWRCATIPYYGPGRSGVHLEIEEGRNSNSVTDEAADIDIEGRHSDLVVVAHALHPWCNPSDLP